MITINNGKSTVTIICDLLQEATTDWGCEDLVVAYEIEPQGFSF